MAESKQHEAMNYRNQKSEEVCKSAETLHRVRLTNIVESKAGAFSTPRPTSGAPTSHHRLCSSQR